MIRSGELERRVREDGLRGITSNPKTFHDAIADTGDYAAQIAQLAEAGLTPAQVYEGLVVTDVQAACDILRTVYDRTQGADGFVSLEVSPHLAHDTAGSINEARRLWAAVDRPNLFIKIPGTAAGVPAIEELLAEGLNINITLLFSIEHYEAVAHAYLRALHRRAIDRRSLSNIASVASFFLSRIDVLVDELLRQRINDRSLRVRPETLLGKAAIANAKLAYQRFAGIFRGEEWASLASRGANVQRLLWASTGVKNPTDRDVRYIEPLIGPFTVTTMPVKTIAAFADHGVAACTLEQNVEAARQTFADLEAVGIDFEQVAWRLLNEGIQKFIDAFDGLRAYIGERCARQGGPATTRQGDELQTVSPQGA
jgi:transaldolase